MAMATTPKATGKAVARTKVTTKTKAAPAEGGFDTQERAAMQARARELKAQARAGRQRADGEAEVQAVIAQMPESERDMATRLHALVLKAAPMLVPRTWYGMPAYAKDGKVLCFFQGASKFGSRYATLGFTDQAALDDGPMWPTAYALTHLDKAVEQRVLALVRQAAG